VELSRCIDLFLKFKSKELAKRTLHEYEKDLNLFLKFVGDRNVKEIRTADVMLFRSSLDCSPSLINRRISALNTFFNYLVDMEVLEKNPVKKSLRIRKVKQKVPDALTKGEIDTILKAARERCERDYLMAKLMLYCGLRISELLALRKKDIVENKGKAVLRVVGKGNKERFIPLPSKLLKELQNYLEGINSERLFPLTYPGAKFVFDQISKATGIKLHPHKLRHTFATILVDKGVDIRVIQEFLGHASPNTTARYAKVRQDVMFSVVESVFT